MYVLGYNESKQLTMLNQAIKENLKTYLGYYRILTDAVNIKDAFIINIGVDFEISVLPNYNSNEILLKCVDAIRSYFDVTKWQINQPIIKSDITTTLANVKGVQSVVGVKMLNLYDTDFGYSGNIYDLQTATRNGVIYPSLDPSIFELKFANQDVRGRVVSY
jgi:phage-related baseplate assembly protein